MAEDSMPPHPSKSSSKSSKRPPSKTTAAYWKSQVFLEEKPGWSSGNYYVRIQVRKDRRKVVLKATTKEAAADEALAKYLEVLVNGWPVVEGKVVVGSKGEGSAEQTSGPTIADWRDLAIKVSPVQEQTFLKYYEALRCIVGETLGLARARAEEARQKIHSYPLASISRAMLQDWIDQRLENLRGRDPVVVSRGQNTIRTTLRNARGLFSECLRDAVDERFQIKLENPFVKLRQPKSRHFGYTSRFNAELLLKAAAESLGTVPAERASEEAVSRYEQWKILYLALVAGLRYNEIDKLRVQDVCAEKQRISIQPHEEFQPKTVASAGDILVGEAAGRVLQEMLGCTKGTWFVAEARSNRNLTYRTGLHQDRLLKWLRNYEERGERPLKSVPKPLHELRKEAGTIVNQNYGLNEAKTFLRHGSTATTATFYVASKGRVITGLG